MVPKLDTSFLATTAAVAAFGTNLLDSFCRGVHPFDVRPPVCSDGCYCEYQGVNGSVVLWVFDRIHFRPSSHFANSSIHNCTRCFLDRLLDYFHWTDRLGSGCVWRPFSTRGI